MRIALVCLLAALATAPGAGKKVVFLAGTKSHGPGEHEYEKGLKLLARCLERSPSARGFRTEVHLNGWPQDARTLDDADAIVVYCDGADHHETDDPLLIGDRMEMIGRQMKRGAGLVLLHYATITPVKRAPEFLEWVGGYFDYETGTAANHWYSKIQTAAAHVELPTPRHPVCRGLMPFDLRDEYYYNLRFRDPDPRRSDILSVRLPNEPSPQTVAWAVQRRDGGRGFAFTGGHPYSNFRDENFRRLMLNAIVWAARANVPRDGVQSTVPNDPDITP